MITSTIAAIIISTTSVRAEIVKQATGSKVPVAVAVSIADCESKFKYDAKNPKSTATGVYQFTAPTWKWINARGSPNDYKENIRMFIKYYPRYPNWWAQCR